MRTPFVNDTTNGGVFVKGEQEIVDRICFEDEEKIVEREVRKPLTLTPEEFAAPEKEDTGSSKEKKLGRRRLPQGPKTAAGWRYRVRRDLLNKAGGVCPSCLEKKHLRLYRANKNGETPKEADYILLCRSCRKQGVEKREREKREGRKEKEKEERETKIWARGPGPRGGSLRSTETGFYNSIRELVFKRDNHKCLLCEALGKKKYEEGVGTGPGLGLAPLIPPSKGGEWRFDNYFTCCAFHRASKGDKLCLDYIEGEISFDYWLSKQLDTEPTVRTAGGRISIPTYTLAAVEQFLARRVTDEEEKPEVRKRAEQLHIELSKTDEDRKKERERVAW